MIGGSADLTGSNSSAMKGVADFSKKDRSGRYIRFGVREHAMAAVSVGLFAYGGYRPFCATFLNFITYAWGAIRLSALAQMGILYISTHDSIELGEDGPTHQPVEVAALVRATPNILYVRPADARECNGAYEIWLKNRTRPTVLALCRSGVPIIKGSCVEGVQKGGYIVRDWKAGTANDKRVVLGGCGSELQFCVDAVECLEGKGYGVRVVSFPCWDIFEEQDAAYRSSVVPDRKDCFSRLYVEAASTMGVEKYFEKTIGMTTFGASAPKNDLLKHFGFTVDNVVSKVTGA
eukprot:Selendium_serpulae@DN6458_c0_g1_i10.p2